MEQLEPRIVMLSRQEMASLSQALEMTADMIEGSVLVQREMDTWRPPVSEYTAIFGGRVWDATAQCSGGWWNRAAAETATGFKKEIRLGGPPFTAGRAGAGPLTVYAAS